MSALKRWATESVARLLREAAIKLAARRERERVEAELWLTRLRKEARMRAADAPRQPGKD